MRILDQQLLRLLESSNDLISAHGRKIVEELIDRMTTFEIIQEILQRDAGADEDRDASEDFRVSVDASLTSHEKPF
jgi:hypothetical protein